MPSGWNRIGSKAPRTALIVAFVSVALCALSLAPAAIPFRAPVVIAAGSAAALDVDPEHGSGPVGATVTLTARIYDGMGCS